MLQFKSKWFYDLWDICILTAGGLITPLGAANGRKKYDHVAPLLGPGFMLTIKEKHACRSYNPDP
jgi:hypothetical protein